jgi:hypothetical protein
MDERHEKKPHYLVNKKSRLIVSTVEFMSDREAESRNERILQFISANLEWVSREDIDREYSEWEPV